MMHRVLAGLAAAGVGSTLWMGAAGADPEGETRVLVCDNGQTYTVAVNGNGVFTPAFDTDSNAVLVPVLFGTFTGTLYDDEGNVVRTRTDPPIPKGQSFQNLKNAVTCSFTFEEVGDASHPDLPEGYKVVGSGTVVMRVTPGA